MLITLLPPFRRAKTGEDGHYLFPRRRHIDITSSHACTLSRAFYDLSTQNMRAGEYKAVATLFLVMSGLGEISANSLIYHYIITKFRRTPHSALLS